MIQKEIMDQWFQKVINTAAAIVMALMLFVVAVFSIMVNFL